MVESRPRLSARVAELTERQEQVLALIEKGRTNFEIAQELGISLEGAKYHVREIMARLEVESREEAVAAWRGRPSRGRLRRFAPVLFALRWPAAAAASLAVTGAVVAGVLVATRGGADVNEAAGADPTIASTPTIAGDDPPATPVPEIVESTASAAVGPYPLGTRTGDPVIDAVLEAVEAGDRDRVFELIHYTGVACRNPEAGVPLPPGTFRCPNGEPDGTLIPSVMCEGTEGCVIPEGDPRARRLVDAVWEGLYPLDARVIAVASQGPSLEPGRRSIYYASGQLLVVDADGVVAFLTAAIPVRGLNATAYLLPPLPEDPRVYARGQHEELASAAFAAVIVDDQALGYGIFPAWEAAGYSIVAGDQPAHGRTISAIAMRIDPEPVERTAPRHAVYFVTGDDAGNCIASGIGITLTSGGGFVTPLSEVPILAGTPCTAEANLAARR